VNRVIQALAEELVDTELSGNRYCRKYQQSIKSAQRHFFNWTETQKKSNFNLITRKDMMEYQKELLLLTSKLSGELLAPVTIYDRFNAIKLLFSVLYRSGEIKENVTHGLTLEVPKRIGWQRRAFTTEELNYILGIVRHRIIITTANNDTLLKYFQKIQAPRTSKAS
jgi:site-specific recombinase XerD